MRWYRLYSFENDWSIIVRDVGWYLNVLVLVVSLWNGLVNDMGMVSVYGYNEVDDDDGEESEDEGMVMGRVVDEKLNVLWVVIGGWR